MVNIYLKRYTAEPKNYSFYPPTYIDENEFNYYKELIKMNPNVKLNLKLKENKFIKGIKVLAQIVLFPLKGLQPGLIEAEMISYKNKKRAEALENEFWKILKEVIEESHTYEDFTETMLKECPFYKIE